MKILLSINHIRLGLHVSIIFGSNGCRIVVIFYIYLWSIIYGLRCKHIIRSVVISKINFIFVISFILNISYGNRSYLFLWFFYGGMGNLLVIRKDWSTIFDFISDKRSSYNNKGTQTWNKSYFTSWQAFWFVLYFLNYLFRLLSFSFFFLCRGGYQFTFSSLLIFHHIIFGTFYETRIFIVYAFHAYTVVKYVGFTWNTVIKTLLCLFVTEGATSRAYIIILRKLYK